MPAKLRRVFDGAPPPLTPSVVAMAARRGGGDYQARTPITHVAHWRRRAPPDVDVYGASCSRNWTSTGICRPSFVLK